MLSLGIIIHRHYKIHCPAKFKQMQSNQTKVMDWKLAISWNWSKKLTILMKDCFELSVTWLDIVLVSFHASLSNNDAIWNPGATKYLKYSSNFTIGNILRWSHLMPGTLRLINWWVTLALVTSNYPQFCYEYQLKIISLH